MADAGGAPFATRIGVASGPVQLLLDLSVLVGNDDRSGVQRVVRNVARTLLRAPPAGYTVAPVYDAGGHYAYARRFVLGSAAADAQGVTDEPIQVRPGDVFLGLDLAPNHVPGNQALLHSLRQHGVRLYFVVYDLLPIRQPAMFADGAAPWFARWVSCVASVADGLVCISRATADELLEWLDAFPVARSAPLRVGYFHLGADLDAAEAGAAPSHAEQAVLAQAGTRPTFLMVGTLEPRKMHAQVVAAFELLWQEGREVNLVIAGKRGWMVDALVQHLRGHPQLGQRLFWLEGASDAALECLYRASAALVAASSGEGFGLPLIEAAQRGLPVIARALPVFREVAGEHAFYFTAEQPEALADAIRAWLALYARGQQRPSAGMPWMTWERSAASLIAAIDSPNWYRQASTRLA